MDEKIILDITSIDNMIRFWRQRLREDKGEDVIIASCYVDAFQTIRVNHGLPPLPREEK
jgi:hypothetical protein